VRNGVQPPARFGHAAGIVNGQVMIIFGGSGAAGVLNDIWQFDIAGFQWRQLSPSTPVSAVDWTGRMVIVSCVCVCVSISRAAGTPPPASMTPVGGTIGRHFVIYSDASPNTLCVPVPSLCFLCTEPLPLVCVLRESVGCITHRMLVHSHPHQRLQPKRATLHILVASLLALSSPSWWESQRWCLPCGTGACCVGLTPLSPTTR
jgi:hypothetical protein